MLLRILIYFEPNFIFGLKKYYNQCYFLSPQFKGTLKGTYTKIFSKLRLTLVANEVLIEALNFFLLWSLFVLLIFLTVFTFIKQKSVLFYENLCMKSLSTKIFDKLRNNSFCCMLNFIIFNFL